jgi:hypothetical protein
VGRSEGLIVAPADPLLRITQLEQNLKFLQDQHKLMLTSLHQEVEQLRQRNRGKQHGDILYLYIIYFFQASERAFHVCTNSVLITFVPVLICYCTNSAVDTALFNILSVSFFDKGGEKWHTEL